MKIKGIINSIESLAPLQLQESYDNSGFLVGDYETEFTRAIVSIDITEDVIDEAINKSCNLIISHHPLIFGKLSKIAANTATGKCIIKAIKNDIAIYAVHTNIDNVANGVNAKLCEKLGITNCKILKPKKNILKKLITYCPTDKAEAVRSALFGAGAGNIGNYDSCSYNTNGFGSFRALDNSNPYVGKLNELHLENEIRIETIYPSYIERELLKALFASHPYEEVAYDIYNIDNEFSKAGEGMIGELSKATDIKTFFQNIKTILGIEVIRHSEIKKKNVQKIAVCGGAGGFLIKDAITSGADVFLTADLKYHQFFEGEKRMIIADIGHYESEQFTKEILVDFLNKKFPTFAFLNSNVNTNSVKYYN